MVIKTNVGISFSQTEDISNSKRAVFGYAH